MAGGVSKIVDNILCVCAFMVVEAVVLTLSMYHINPALQ